MRRATAAEARLGSYVRCYVGVVALVTVQWVVRGEMSGRESRLSETAATSEGMHERRQSGRTGSAR